MAKTQTGPDCPKCGTPDAVLYTPHDGQPTYACRGPKCGHLFHAAPEAAPPPPEPPPNRPRTRAPKPKT